VQKEDILKFLASHKEEFKDRYTITKLGLFGSHARDEATEKSDIDIVVSMQKPDAFLLLGFKDELEESFKTHVDIVRIRDKMNEYLKNRINKEAVYV
jgi:uncharacterized protein